jgi:hypothetical protein
MSKCFTQEWLDDLKKTAESLPGWPGFSCSVQFVVTGGPEGVLEYYWIFEDGELNECQLGRLEDPDVTLAPDYEIALKVHKGELTPRDIALQGTGRATGDMAKVMAFIPLSDSPEYKNFVARSAEITEF